MWQSSFINFFSKEQCSMPFFPALLDLDRRKKASSVIELTCKLLQVQWCLHDILWLSRLSFNSCLYTSVCVEIYNCKGYTATFWAHFQYHVYKIQSTAIHSSQWRGRKMCLMETCQALTLLQSSKRSRGDMISVSKDLHYFKDSMYQISKDFFK